ncbi:MAG: pilus assembly protein [Rhodospirillales bacterium]|nr:pilus assembly protein [Rhodospirillales bacterium]
MAVNATMRGRRRPFLACCRGATAVEFAIVAPLFLAMMVGVFELSRAMWIKASMQYAVEETSR